MLGSRRPPTVPAQDAPDNVEERSVSVNPDDMSLLDLIADAKPSVSSLDSDIPIYLNSPEGQ